MMTKRAEKVEVSIEELKDSSPTDDGSGVVLETEAVVDGARHDTSIEVPHEDVPAAVVALLNADGPVVPPDPVQAPVRCLGAGVVHSDDPSSVRFHLQFDSGQVLPIEMTREAALALCRGLLTHAGGAAGVGSVRLAFPPAFAPAVGRPDGHAAKPDPSPGPGRSNGSKRLPEGDPAPDADRDPGERGPAA